MGRNKNIHNLTALSKKLLNSMLILGTLPNFDMYTQGYELVKLLDHIIKKVPARAHRYIIQSLSKDEIAILMVALSDQANLHLYKGMDKMNRLDIRDRICKLGYVRVQDINALVCRILTQLKSEKDQDWLHYLKSRQFYDYICKLEYESKKHTFRSYYWEDKKNKHRPNKDIFDSECRWFYEFIMKAFPRDTNAYIHMRDRKCQSNIQWTCIYGPIHGSGAYYTRTDSAGKILEQYTADGHVYREKSNLDMFYISSSNDVRTYYSPFNFWLEQNKILRNLCYKKIDKVYSLDTVGEAQKKLNEELAIIEKTNEAGYVVMCYRIVRELQKGRIIFTDGSDITSIVLYILGISTIDPLRKEEGNFYCIDNEYPPSIVNSMRLLTSEIQDDVVLETIINLCSGEVKKDDHDRFLFVPKGMHIDDFRKVPSIKIIPSKELSLLFLLQRRTGTGQRVIKKNDMQVLKVFETADTDMIPVFDKDNFKEILKSVKVMSFSDLVTIYSCLETGNTRKDQKEENIVTTQFLQGKRYPEAIYTIDDLMHYVSEELGCDYHTLIWAYLYQKDKIRTNIKWLRRHGLNDHIVHILRQTENLPYRAEALIHTEIAWKLAFYYVYFQEQYRDCYKAVFKQ